jgi:hypothetical protein
MITENIEAVDLASTSLIGEIGNVAFISNIFLSNIESKVRINKSIKQSEIVSVITSVGINAPYPIFARKKYAAQVGITVSANIMVM